MAKSNYLFGLLLCAVVCVHFGFDSRIVKGNQESRTKNQDYFRVHDGLTANKEKRAWVKKIYDSQIGVREAGVNGGPDVERYLRYVGLAKGNPWCAAFVCWVLGEARVENPRTGWSPGLFGASKIIWKRGESGKVKGESDERYASPINLAIVNGQLATDRATPTTGDIFGIYFLEKKRIAHVGFVDQWDTDWLITVEGNTNDSGAREGDGVYRKRRPVRSIYRVARYIN